MNQEEFFDSVAPKWEEMIEVRPARIERLLSQVPWTPACRILDVGTGTGVLVPFLRRPAPESTILGVDISAGMLRVARNKFAEEQGVTFKKINVETEPVPGEYDLIILYSVFPHFQDRTRTIAKLVADNLTPGGRLMIAHSNSREYLNSLHRKAGETVKEDRLIAVDRQRALLEGAGLTVCAAYEDNEIYYLVISKEPELKRS